MRAVAAGVVRSATRLYQPAPHHGTVVVLDHPVDPMTTLPGGTR